MAIEEVVLPFPQAIQLIETASRVRSTLINSSLASLRHGGFEQRYFQNLDPTLHETVRFAPAGVWLPIHVAEGHYQACDQLGLSASSIIELGASVSRITQKSVLNTVLRLATEAGATPWRVLPYTQRLWEKLFVGGGWSIIKTGPKDMRAEHVGNPLLRFAYFRSGLVGIMKNILAGFTRQAFLQELPFRPPVQGIRAFAMKAMWV